MASVCPFPWILSIRIVGHGPWLPGNGTERIGIVVPAFVEMDGPDSAVIEPFAHSFRTFDQGRCALRHPRIDFCSIWYVVLLLPSGRIGY
jgi:hypothetical protein